MWKKHFITLYMFKFLRLTLLDYSCKPENIGDPGNSPGWVENIKPYSKNIKIFSAMLMYI